MQNLQEVALAVVLDVVDLQDTEDLPMVMHYPRAG